MKKVIIITVMLVSAFGLNAQTTDRSTRKETATEGATRKAENERKSGDVKSDTRTREVSPAKTETRTRENTPVRTTTSTDRREETTVRSAGKRPEPANNEVRTRETPAVRTTTTSRNSVTSAPETRTNGRSVNQVSPIDQERPRTVNTRQEPVRNTGTSSDNGRSYENNNSGSSRTQNTQRSVGSVRVVNSDRNREYVPRTEPVYVEKRQAYRTPERTRTVRTANQSVNYVYKPIEYRRNYYPYAEPRRLEIIWDIHMYHEYRHLYPHYDYWYYPMGYRIHTVSAYDANRYVGEIARIYGRVSDVWHERQSDEYYLYIGGPYPYQDFTVILPGKYARRYSYRPERYFANRNLTVTGLVSMWDNRPEMLIRKRSQVEIYF